MRATILVENTPSKSVFEAEHGLSVVIETNERQYLFDVGASDAFSRNARKMGVALENVDALFLSHGHNDHTGGLPTFIQINRQAAIVATSSCFKRFFSHRPNGEYVEISAPRCENLHGLNERLLFNDGQLQFNLETTLFTLKRDPKRERGANSNLYVLNEERGELLPDDFAHEQNLVVVDPSGIAALFVGCAHCGIDQIMSRSAEILGRAPDVALGGFHLVSRGSGARASLDAIQGITEKLAQYKTRYFVGHCVDANVYDVVKKRLGDQVEIFRSGDVFSFERSRDHMEIFHRPN